MNSQLLNFLLFQLGWFACVLGAANQMAMAGLAVAVVVIFTHLLVSRHWLEELIIMIGITAVGYTWDSALVQLGLFTYGTGNSAAIAPLWIAAMWAMFATTLNSSLSWLKERYLVAALLGAAFGPVAYLSASKLGAVSMLIESDALILQSAAWAVLMPGMLLYSKRVKQKLAQPNLENFQ